MGNHENGSSVLSDLLHAAVALGLEEHISHGKRSSTMRISGSTLIDNAKASRTNIPLEIGFHRLVNKVSDIRKFQDIRKLLVHLFFGKAHHGSVHVNILNAGVIHVEARSQLQKRRDNSTHPDLSALSGSALR